MVECMFFNKFNYIKNIKLISENFQSILNYNIHLQLI
jgi:hypothetical protein